MQVFFIIMFIFVLPLEIYACPKPGPGLLVSYVVALFLFFLVFSEFRLEVIVGIVENFMHWYIICYPAIRQGIYCDIPGLRSIFHEAQPKGI